MALRYKKIEKIVGVAGLGVAKRIFVPNVKWKRFEVICTSDSCKAFLELLIFNKVDDGLLVFYIFVPTTIGFDSS